MLQKRITRISAASIIKIGPIIFLLNDIWVGWLMLFYFMRWEQVLFPAEYLKAHPEASSTRYRASDFYRICINKFLFYRFFADFNKKSENFGNYSQIAPFSKAANIISALLVFVARGMD